MVGIGMYLTTLDREGQLIFKKAISYVRKSFFWFLIKANDDIVKDLFQEAYLFTLEITKKKKAPDFKYWFWGIKRKYMNIVGYDATLFSSEAEWIFQAYGEEYLPKGATRYKQVGIYLPEDLLEILDNIPRLTRSKAVAYLIEEFYREPKNKLNENLDNFFSSEKKKGSVKLPIEVYLKLKALKKERNVNINQIVITQMGKLIEKAMLNNT